MRHRNRRTTVHYAGPRYPTLKHRKLVRFIDHSTVGVSNYNPSIVGTLLSTNLIHSTTSLCDLHGRSLLGLRHVNRGSTSGLLTTLSRDGGGRLSGLLFTLNVHRIKTGMTHVLTARFNDVRGLRRTRPRRLTRVHSVNSGVTRDTIA